MNEKIPLLDHGFIRLVDHMGSDLSISQAARTSHDAAWRAGEDEKGDEKLIHYLWKNHHATPFEAVVFTFEVYAPIFVLRQWHRHRTMSYNELSGRYRELPEKFYLPEPESIGSQATINKQGRDLSGLTVERESEVQIVKTAMELSFTLYRELLAAGWPRELARTVLPLSTYSHMFATLNLRNLFGFLTLRADSHAQYEIRVYAEAMIELVRPIVPVAVAAWEKSR